MESSLSLDNLSGQLAQSLFHEKTSQRSDPRYSYSIGSTSNQVTIVLTLPRSLLRSHQLNLILDSQRIGLKTDTKISVSQCGLTSMVEFCLRGTQFNVRRAIKKIYFNLTTYCTAYLHLSKYSTNQYGMINELRTRYPEVTFELLPQGNLLTLKGSYSDVTAIQQEWFRHPNLISGQISSFGPIGSKTNQINLLLSTRMQVKSEAISKSFGSRLVKLNDSKSLKTFNDCSSSNVWPSINMTWNQGLRPFKTRKTLVSGQVKKITSEPVNNNNQIIIDLTKRLQTVLSTSKTIKNDVKLCQALVDLSGQINQMNLVGTTQLTENKV